MLRRQFPVASDQRELVMFCKEMGGKRLRTRERDGSSCLSCYSLTQLGLNAPFLKKKKKSRAQRSPQASAVGAPATPATFLICHPSADICQRWNGWNTCKRTRRRRRGGEAMKDSTGCLPPSLRSSRGSTPAATPASTVAEAERGCVWRENTLRRPVRRGVRKRAPAISSLRLDSGRARWRRQTLRHEKVKGLHQIKDCLKSELPELYAHHLSCCQ